MFSRLFSLVWNEEEKIAECGVWVGDWWAWKFNWRRNLFLWEEELVEQLYIAIENSSLSRDCLDKWKFKFKGGGVSYSCKEAYKVIQELGVDQEVWREDDVKFHNSVWKCGAPLKTVIFAWLVLLDKFPSRANLLRRGVISTQVDAFCPL
jgi:hypothetical protein